MSDTIAADQGAARLALEQAKEATTNATTPSPMRGSGDRRTARRPGPLAALLSGVVWPNWTAASLLFATMWLPHFTGCDGRPIRPLDTWSEIDGGEDVLTAAMMTWPYFWAALAAVSLIVVALLRPRRPDRILFAASATVYLLIVLTFLISAGVYLAGPLISVSEQRDVDWIWIFTPALMMPGMWAAAAVYRGEWYAGWARLTTGLAMLAIPTIVMLGVLSRESRYGFNLAMLCCGALVPSCWALRWQGPRALVDRTMPREMPQFRLLHLGIWVTLIAALCGYYRFLAFAQ